MKRSLFLFCALLFPVVTPLPWSPVVHAQPPKTKRKQIQAVDLWAGVIRRGQTAKVMWEVADLLTEVCNKIDNDESMLMQLDFRAALHYMESAAKTKAQGLEGNNKSLLKVAEQTIQNGQARVRGRFQR